MDEEFDAQYRTYFMTCPNCGAKLVVVCRELPGFADKEPVYCPVCKNYLREVRCDLGVPHVEVLLGDSFVVNAIKFDRSRRGGCEEKKEEKATEEVPEKPTEVAKEEMREMKPLEIEKTYIQTRTQIIRLLDYVIFDRDLRMILRNSKTKETVTVWCGADGFHIRSKKVNICLPLLETIKYLWELAKDGYKTAIIIRERE